MNAADATSSVPGPDLASARRAAGFSVREVSERCGLSRNRIVNLEGSFAVRAAIAERIMTAIRSMSAEAES
jgi:transcriptional regulator with XRE-family HTH domain